jgi:hypothetical protein
MGHEQLHRARAEPDLDPVPVYLSTPVLLLLAHMENRCCSSIVQCGIDWDQLSPSNPKGIMGYTFQCVEENSFFYLSNWKEFLQNHAINVKGYG